LIDHLICKFCRVQSSHNVVPLGLPFTSDVECMMCMVFECRKLAHPYHVSYAPVSAQDSELQSLSSDALTDDTMSYTDSSV